jgi:hypothetical protein
MQILVGAGLMAAPIATAHAQAASVFMKAPLVMPEPNAVITIERTRAYNVFKALTGVSIPIDDPRLKSMETYIRAGNIAAAEHVATDDPLFYNFRVAGLAAKMSTRDETARASLSDFVATFVGVVRDSDSTPATQLLTGNFYYMGDNAVITSGGGTAVPSNMTTDVLSSKGMHYQSIANQNLSLKAVLKRVDGQQIVRNNAAVAHPDPAGLLTSVAFVAAHATAGTNRRMVEYAYREFMCTPMANWADGTSPDDRIGQDVDRMPGGSPNKFLTTCKNCHANLDGQRGAFGFLDFDDGSGLPTFGTAVVPKMLRNETTYPDGFRMSTNAWVNYANVGNNADRFGWRSSMTGSGIKQFGDMLAKSQGFSRCMVRRVFTDVCKRAPVATEEPMVRSVASQFEASNYHLRNLFEMVVLRPECGIN